MNKTTAFIFFGIILVGLVGSLIYFTNREKIDSAIQPFVTTTEVGEDPVEKSGETPKPKESASDSVETKPETATKPKSTTPEGKASKEFASAEEAMKALAEKAGTKDFNAFLDFVSNEAIADNIRPEVKKLVESPELFLSKEKPFSEVSKSAKSVRWALNFEPKAEGAGRELYADLALGTDTSKTLTISKISLPLDLTSVVVPEPKGEPGSAPSTATPEKLASALEGVDALTVAHAFSKAVINRDFKVARALSDPAMVTDERVAALMIAIEEGDFALKLERPLVVTLSRDDITWVLTRVESGESTSEFALELGQAEKSWAVNGLTFSKVLSALAARAGGGGVAYSPIVEDPMGGDSLVLYFEFDQASLTPRGSRQLAVIADILSQGSDRTIRINGHADAKGTDEYNAQLSDRRAAAIRQGLISLGVNPDQVITEAFGETKPRRPNFNPDGTDNRSGQSQNRRAEVYLDF